MGGLPEVPRADIPHVRAKPSERHQALQCRRRYNEPLVFPGTGHLPDTSSDGVLQTISPHVMLGTGLSCGVAAAI